MCVALLQRVSGVVAPSCEQRVHQECLEVGAEVKEDGLKPSGAGAASRALPARGEMIRGWC